MIDFVEVKRNSFFRGERERERKRKRKRERQRDREKERIIYKEREGEYVEKES